MSNLNKAFLIESSGNIMTPRCRMVYGDLFKASQVKGQGKHKFRISLLIPAKSDVELLRETVMELATEKLGKNLKTTKWRNPLLKTGDEPRFADIADDFPLMLRPNSDNRPQVTNPAATKIITEDEAPDEIYNGRWCRASISVYWYGADKSPIPGVGLGLSNVQLLDHDDPIDVGNGRVAASSEFAAVEEGAMAGMED